nr:IS256 family transposase [Tessaracoccus flavescens]
MNEQNEHPELEPAVPAVRGPDMAELAEHLVATAGERGIALTGEGGLLAALTKQVLQSALEAEMSVHLGYDRHDPVGRNRGNSRNGSTPKTVTTEVGKVTVQVPRDREGSFEPRIIAKRQRRLLGFDEQVISLYAKGMTTGDIAAHLAEVYDTDISRDTVSTVTAKVAEDLKAWQARPLDRIYPVIIIDAIILKIREGNVANRPVYVAMGLNLDGIRDVLGIWVGPSGGEGAKQWMTMLTDLRNRGIMDAYIVCCDGLKGLPEAIGSIWPLAVVQTCVVHLVRNSLRYSSRQHWQKITSQLRTIYTASTIDEAEYLFEEFTEVWQAKYPAMINLWRSSWAEFVPFLAFPAEIRKLVYTTNAIESLNARFRAATRRRGHFPDEAAALKVLYLSIRHREPNRPNPTGQIAGWKNILNVLAMTYGDRLGIN